MLNYILIALGAAFAITGIILLIKRMGEGTTSKIKIPLIGEIQTANSSVIIFVVGAALIFLGGTIKQENSSQQDDIKNRDTTFIKPIPETIDTAKRDTIKKPVDKPEEPLKEFTLTAGQQQVFNDLQVTFNLQPGIINLENPVVKIRIWRPVNNPLSDTAALDPSGNAPGVQVAAFKVNAITPIDITDVGQFKFYVTSPVLSGKNILSVLVKMYKN